MTAARRSPQPVEEQPKQHWIGKLEPAVRLITQASLILAIVCLTYILFAVFKGHLTQPTDQIVNNMRLVGNLCTIAIVVFAVFYMLLHLEENEVAIGMGALGAVFYFGFSYLIGFFLTRQGASANQATEVVNQKFISAGQFVIGSVIVRFLYVFVVSLPELASRERKKANVGFEQQAKDASSTKVGRPSVFSRCWQLPYCRETVKKACPAFIARKSCWKFGKGCYCDEEMIAKIVRGETGLADSSRAGAAFLKADLAARTGAKPQQKTKRPPCGKCYIYLEHQNLKHRAVGPVVIPVTVVILYLLKDVIFTGYEQASGFIGGLFKQFAFSPDKSASGVGESLAQQTEYFILFILAVFVLIYVTKFIEFCIYKLKI
ncbi:MAG: hypothetical protein AUJ92_17860 [Armatimonadetes bacterium CG2_30_59_28]|nr:hypothetical protein [Armatimonadota bacterium]OIO90837.1 MAG: hypothetical protein AUJ92_17860 [Armatimonadetes bacterium CG2_30_59_28]PIU65349.1 MAG: hypothetical protein COS85_09130 [Armatimonadetes bacterium CG07_land_8_20_14_0_80_59_28]PIX39099.1 MAG: hypothetical protein COZ56_18640 [Armatimonadetes bacterium CG_4_8_14_3_um_filter_58_9]PJB78084.1 MAG: hypothetical protein CO095_00895 [Armatimonadetes bacterium CG_4_9_14_3_um_filter_58_7]